MKIWPGMWLSVITGCTVGNFVFQAFAAGDWKVAMERSFFQFVAIGSLWVTAWLADWMLHR